MTDEEKEKLRIKIIEHRDAALAFIRKHFTLTESECEDVCSKSLETFYKQVNKSGFLLTSTLKSYFLGICKNKAMEELREKSKMPKDEKAMERIYEDRFDMDRVDTVLSIDIEPSIEQQRMELVRKIVKDLPEPCNTLLWGQYWDCHKTSVLANMVDSSQEAVRQKLTRCRKKFEQRFLKESASLYK